jgi:peroxiredoxin Q/BCP
MYVRDRPQFLAPITSVAVLLLACARQPDQQSSRAAAASEKATDEAKGPLTRGAAAPSVSFPVHTGESISMASLKGKPIVVYFYPKDDTPGCTVEAQEIRDLYTDLQKTNAVVIGVSTDDRESHRAFAEKHALPFLLASDESGEIAKAFGVPLRNGRAARMSFVIGPDGTIKQSFPAVSPKGHAAELLRALGS